MGHCPVPVTGSVLAGTGGTFRRLSDREHTSPKTHVPRGGQTFVYMNTSGQKPRHDFRLLRMYKRLEPCARDEPLVRPFKSCCFCRPMRKITPLLTPHLGLFTNIAREHHQTIAIGIHPSINTMSRKAWKKGEAHASGEDDPTALPA